MAYFLKYCNNTTPRRGRDRQILPPSIGWGHECWSGGRGNCGIINKLLPFSYSPNFNKFKKHLKSTCYLLNRGVFFANFCIDRALLGEKSRTIWRKSCVLFGEKVAYYFWVKNRALFGEKIAYFLNSYLEFFLHNTKNFCKLKNGKINFFAHATFRNKVGKEGGHTPPDTHMTPTL